MSDSPSPPFSARVTELNRRVRERDLAWFREQKARGEFAWLAPHLGPVRYREFGAAIEDGDLDLVGREISALSDGTSFLGEPVRRVTTVGPAVVAPGGSVGDPLTNDLDDPTLLVSRRGAVLPASAVRRERNTLIVPVPAPGNTTPLADAIATRRAISDVRSIPHNG